MLFILQAIYVLLMLGWMFVPVYIASGVSKLRDLWLAYDLDCKQSSVVVMVRLVY